MQYTYTLEQIPDIAREVIPLLKHKIVLFEGEMGVGKTTLIKHVCVGLGVVDWVRSPTFSLVNEYQTAQGAKVYHFDFYKIENIVEAYDIGIETYFDSGYYCLVEWAEKIKELLPVSLVKIKLLYRDIRCRELIITSV